MLTHKPTKNYSSMPLFLCKHSAFPPMPKFWDQIRQLFQQVETSSPSQPAVHHLIERTPEQRLDYDRWKNSLIKRRLIAWIGEQYTIFRLAPDDIDEAVDFLQSPSSNGFIIHFHTTNYSRTEVTHLFDYLKEQVLQQGYRSQLSDLRTYSRPDWVETVERHYLKPPSQSRDAGKMDQRYGNITIELTLRDDRVYQLKFLANNYQDHLYQDAEEFRELMQALLD